MKAGVLRSLRIVPVLAAALAAAAPPARAADSALVKKFSDVDEF
jgi:hypothetical protein